MLSKKNPGLHGTLPILAVSVTKQSIIVSRTTCAQPKGKPPIVNSPAYSEGWTRAFSKQIAKASLN